MTTTSAAQYWSFQIKKRPKITSSRSGSSLAEDQKPRECDREDIIIMKHKEEEAAEKVSSSILIGNSTSNMLLMKEEKVVVVPFLVKYMECKKNHAANIGGYAVDGCREFMPAGEEGSTDGFKCAACSCHRNFHRRELVDNDCCSCHDCSSMSGTPK